MTASPSRNDAAPMPFSAPGESSTLDLTTPTDNLRWALSALELVANGMRRRRSLPTDDVEMRNLRAARDSVSEALRILRATRSETACSADTYAQGFADGLEAAAKEIESHWNVTGLRVDQKEQAERSANAIRRLPTACSANRHTKAE